MAKLRLLLSHGVSRAHLRDSPAAFRRCPHGRGRPAERTQRSLRLWQILPVGSIRALDQGGGGTVRSLTGLAMDRLRLVRLREGIRPEASGQENQDGALPGGPGFRQIASSSELAEVAFLVLQQAEIKSRVECEQ